MSAALGAAAAVVAVRKLGDKGQAQHQRKPGRNLRVLEQLACGGGGHEMGGHQQHQSNQGQDDAAHQQVVVQRVGRRFGALRGHGKGRVTTEQLAIILAALRLHEN